MMKKLSLAAVMFIAMVFVLQCTTAIQKPDPKVMACKSACDTAFDQCVKKSGTSDAKKAACDIAKTKCYNDCEN
jgi:hypothetical protein